MYSYNENVELPNIICLLNAFDNLRVPLHLKKHKPLCITIALWKAIVFYCCSKYTIVWSHTFRFSDFCIKKILSTYKIWDLNPYISIKRHNHEFIPMLLKCLCAIVLIQKTSLLAKGNSLINAWYYFFAYIRSYLLIVEDKFIK